MKTQKTKFAPLPALPVQPKLPEIVNSQQQLASMLGVLQADIQAAKAKGCPAFRSGRIYAHELVAWFCEPLRCKFGGVMELDLIRFRRAENTIDRLLAAGVATVGAEGYFDADGELIAREDIEPMPSVWVELPSKD